MRHRRNLPSTRACVPRKEPISQSSSSKMRQWNISHQSALRLLHGENLIGSNVVQHLLEAARPANFHILDHPVFSEAEMYTAVARRSVSDCGCCLVPLGGAIRGRDMDLRAQAHAVAFCPYEFQQKPVIARFGDIPQNLHRAAENADHGVNPAIIEEIAKSNAAMRGLFHKVGSG